jgi:hypothetical protein
MNNQPYLDLSSKIVHDCLFKVAERVLPRILTQVCRDPNSPFYGCADRNWWHYKIRDFPSIILQQAGAVLWAARGDGILIKKSRISKALITASCQFWNDRATRFRAFEEYYPWEEGYPPLAFSTLSVARLVGEGVVKLDCVREGLNVASQQLSHRFEPNAANQQVAGLAALSWVRRILPECISDEAWESLLLRTLALQDSEGWYHEYGGPDLGYLSVTIDCLWDAYDACKDNRLLLSAVKSFEFIEKMTANTGGHSIGMHNSRNTDYIVPYGIARFVALKEMPSINLRALKLLQDIFSTSDQGDHFLSAVDDRYWCHYIGLSVMRSIQCLSAAKLIKRDTKFLKKMDESVYFPSSGYIWGNFDGIKISVLISTKKGGNLTAFCPDGRFSDFGWVVSSGNKEYVTHWWSEEWKKEFNKGEVDESCWVISGYFVVHKEIESTPFKHLILRLGSMLLGHRLISILKSKLIFKKKGSSIGFKRRVSVQNNVVQVTDHIDNLISGSKVIRAPRSSKRHVASADSFHSEDFSMNNGFRFEEVREQGSKSITIKTDYYF